MPMQTTNEAAPPAGGNGFSIISKTRLLALYKALLRCRALDDRISGSRKFDSFQPSRSGWRSLGPSPHAAAIAAIIDLLPGDTVVASREDFIPRFLRGATANALLANLRNGAISGGASMDSLLKRALSAGRARKRQDERKIAVLFGAEESETSTPWRETLHAAGAERLPVIFLCRHRSAPAGANNGAKKCGVPAVAVDANDVVALYRVACESIAHARRGNGPTLIECVPWPASLAQGRAAARLDAIQNMERYLAQAGIAFTRARGKIVADSGRQAQKRDA